MEDLFLKFGLVDSILIFFLAIGILIGFIKGFSVELFRLLSFLIGLGVSLSFYTVVAKVFVDKVLINAAILEAFILFFMTLILTFVMKLFFYVFRKLIIFQTVYVLERSLGAFTGAIRMFFVFSYLSFLALMLPVNAIDDFYVNKSLYGKFVKEIIPWYKTKSDVFVKNIFDFYDYQSKQQA